MRLFASDTFRMLEQSLNTSALRQRTIANNIANVDTPNYKAKEVVFKDELKRATAMVAKKTHERHIDFSSSSGDGGNRLVTKRTTTMRNNGNNVDIDREMALLAENQIFYNALIDRISGKFQSLKTVARGGQ